MLAQTQLMRGPELSITFTTSEGLQVGKTRLRFRSVDVGRLEELHLSPDKSHVTAIVRLEAAATALSRCSTRFWVVRPHVDGIGAATLETITTGPYIAADVGNPSQACRNFVGLAAPPARASALKGTEFVLRAPSLGSLDVGSPVYFHQVPVGFVLGYEPAQSGEEVDVYVFVKAPLDRYVTSSSRWWRMSSIDIRLNSSGLTLNTPLLGAILKGGVQFEAPGGIVGSNTARNGTTFTLSRNRTDAMTSEKGPAAVIVMRFGESLRGLGVGAPVDFMGVELGEVTRIDVDGNVSPGTSDMVITMNIYPYRLGRRYRDALGQGDGPAGRALLQKMIADGLRGQLRTSNVLTGQHYIALDFFPQTPAVPIDMTHLPVELPTVPNTVEELQDQLASIITKLDHVPFDQIGNNLGVTLGNANVLFGRVNDEIVPQARSTLKAAKESFAAARATLRQDSPLQSDIRRAMAQLRQSLASITALTDYVEQHPESMVWGKPSQP